MYAMPLLYVCGSKDYSAYLDIVKSWGVVGTGLIWTTKTGLAFCFSYHLCGGIRHLVSFFLLFCNYYLYNLVCESHQFYISFGIFASVTSQSHSKKGIFLKKKKAICLFT